MEEDSKRMEEERKGMDMLLAFFFENVRNGSMQVKTESYF